MKKIKNLIIVLILMMIVGISGVSAYTIDEFVEAYKETTLFKELMKNVKDKYNDGNVIVYNDTTNKKIKIYSLHDDTGGGAAIETIFSYSGKTLTFEKQEDDMFSHALVTNALHAYCGLFKYGDCDAFVNNILNNSSKVAKYGIEISRSDGFKSENNEYGIDKNYDIGITKLIIDITGFSITIESRENSLTGDFVGGFSLLLYEGKGCTNDVYYVTTDRLRDGFFDFNDLPYKEYYSYIPEETNPEGYKYQDRKCVNIEIGESWESKEIDGGTIILLSDKEEDKEQIATDNQQVATPSEPSDKTETDKEEDKEPSDKTETDKEEDKEPSDKTETDKEEDKETSDKKEEDKETSDKTEDVKNPNTGFKIGYGIITFIAMLGLGVYIVVRKKSKFPKHN